MDGAKALRMEEERRIQSFYAEKIEEAKSHLTKTVIYKRSIAAEKKTQIE